LISLRESVAELDRFHEVRKATLECYLTAIQGIARYAVELDEQSTGTYRLHLENLASEVGGGDHGALVESRATLRGLLRDYRDQAAKFIAGLRDELATSAAALEKILSSLADADGDSETRIRVTLKGLREIASSQDCAAARGPLSAVADSIEQGIEQIHRQHRLAAAQFQAEIQLLHRRIDQLEAAAKIDDLTKLLSRSEMEERIKSAGGGSYGLLLIRVAGLRAAEVQFNATVAAGLTGAFGKRLRNCLPPNAVIGRWGAEQFMAILGLPKRELLSIARRISESLSGSYSCLNDGKTVRPTIQVSVAVLEREPDEPFDHIFSRVREFLPE
jgi:GGDEF domain-containing protein